MRRFLGLGLVSGLFGVSLLVACGGSGDSSTLFGTGGVATGGAGGAGMGGAGMGGAVTSSGSATGAGPGSSSSSSASASSSSASGSSSSASASSSSASSGGFDPQVCSQCSFANCQAEIFACGQACQSFVTCAQNCADQACVDACLAMYPQAEPTYKCTCAACAADCGGLCPSGGSGASTSASVSSASASSASGAGGGGPACASCGEVLQGSQDPLCPGSGALLQNLFTCTCQNKCTNECAGSCAGGQADQACFTCVQGKCGPEFSACIND